MTDPQGKSLGTWMVRTLSDYPPGGHTATDFPDLCRQYINYFIDKSRLLDSSSSSSSTENEIIYEIGHAIIGLTNKIGA